MFFFGLSGAMRHLWSMLSHMNLQTKAFLMNPNQRFYQNQTIDQVTDRSLVVQPLIGENQAFDIGVTIWARASPEEERAWLRDAGKNVSETQTRRTSSLIDGPVDIGGFGSKQRWIQNDYEYTSMFKVRGFNTTTPDALFKIIYSDIAFSHVRLSDISKQWTGRDALKAAFTILPRPNSALRNLQTYSSWIHTSGITQKRAWPFPLGSEENSPKSLGDEATDFLSFVMPLVRSFQVPHPCVNASVQADSSYPIRTNAPFILSRYELEIMNFDSFNKSHSIIKSAKVFRPNEIDPQYKKMRTWSWDSEESPMKWVTTCHNRDYYRTGILETLFEFGAPLDDGYNQIEWAYAPYFEANQNGFRPKRLHPIPTQTICNSSSIDPHDRRTIKNPWAFKHFRILVLDSGLNISWHITYSGISFKSGSDYQQVMLQDRIDQYSASLFGIYREGNAYGRRRLVLNFLSKSLLIIAGAFDALYWYTRNTTSFISIPGTLLLAVASLVNCEFIIQGRDAWSAYQVLLPQQTMFTEEDQSIVLTPPDFAVMPDIPIVLQAIWMSMTALRIEWVWPSGSEDTLLRRAIPYFTEDTT
ncbi:hypothetical protein BDP27DRAFT_1349663 [Rhodocollybia butyracea]|uniref:Uncharacterized protein n=1 Tax=Rhodocollybia butyracea TaxID=206335 RepID=A0A9P5TW69_9AGAR|nr:hypothetical protein BDP27DRAFT_1349663 [Rhodocollybia butyracea]